MRRLLILVLAGVTLAGCGGGSGESSNITEGTNVVNSPLGTMEALVTAGGKLQEMQAEMEKMGPVEPLHFKELLPFLPEPISGWEAEEPKGSSSSMGTFSLSEVERTYRMDQQQIEVKIADWAYRQELWAPFFIAAGFSQETTEGYNKGIMVGEDPGREEYHNENKDGTLSVLVGKRFLLTIEGDGIDAAALRTWFDHVNTAGLRAKG
jgi:hypothetical protein